MIRYQDSEVIGNPHLEPDHQDSFFEPSRYKIMTDDTNNTWQNLDTSYKYIELYSNLPILGDTYMVLGDM